MTDGRDQTHSKTGRWLMWFAAFGLLAGLTALFQATDKGRAGLIESTSEAGRAMVVLQRDRSGHYIAEGEINGVPVVFLVDTGATDVALPEKIARAMGLEFGPKVPVMTAAGQVTAWRTRLDRVSLGSVSRRNVRALITRGTMAEVLLGMSFLEHFSIRQQGDQLIIESGGVTG